MNSTKLFTLILLLASTLCISAQEDTFEVTRFQKTAIGTSGTFAYFPKIEDTVTFDVSYSPDSSAVYTGDVYFGDFHYAVIVVKMKETILTTEEEKKNMLVSYLDFLQTSFSIVVSAGYGYGHTLESSPEAIGAIDYWVDEENDQWAIKGWVDSNTIGVMMLYGATEFPNFNVQSVYLDGFRFN